MSEPRKPEGRKGRRLGILIAVGAFVVVVVVVVLVLVLAGGNPTNMPNR